MPEQVERSLGDALTDALARLDAGDAASADSSARELYRQLQSLACELREPVPEADYELESACCRASDAVRRLGREPSPATLQAAEPASQAAVADLGELGQYRLLEKLGEGGMGAVYKALHTRLEKLVAIKVLPIARMRDDAAIARFQREMKAVGRLDHPHIVRAMDAGEHEGMHYLVMEYVAGADLSQIARQTGPLPLADACELVRQAALGLQEAHQHGLVHRDIKPSNLMLTPRGEVKILDLGLALLSDAHSPDAHALTGAGQVMGTLDYMAPEQGGDAHVVDIRADIYSLGATLYRLLAGESIYHGEQCQTPVQKMMALATQPAPPIQERREGIPDALAAIIHRMLEKTPDDRYSTPAEVAGALAPWAAGADLTALLERTAEAAQGADVEVLSTASIARSALTETISTAPRYKPQPEPQRRRAVRWAIVAAVVAAVVAAAVIVIRSGDRETEIRIPDGQRAIVTIDGDRVTVEAGGRIEARPAGAGQLEARGQSVDLIAHLVEHGGTELNGPAVIDPRSAEAREIPFDPDDDGSGQRHWRIEGGKLFAKTGDVTRLFTRYEPPAEYDVILVVTRLDAPMPLGVGLASAGGQFVIAFDQQAAEGTPHTSITSEHVNSRRDGLLLKEGETATIECLVRHREIAVLRDGALWHKWAIPPSRLAARRWWTIDGRTVVSLVSHTSGLEISRWELTPVTSGQEAPPPRTPQLETVLDKLASVNRGQRLLVEHQVRDGQVVGLVIRGSYADLSPLAALPRLTTLETDVTPDNHATLAGLPLEQIRGVSLTPFHPQAADFVKSLPRLESINGAAAAEWLARPQHLEGLRKTLADRPPEAQLETVRKLLIEYNPDYDGELKHRTEAGQVTLIDLREKKNIRDLSPLAVLPLKELSLSGTGVADLSPLRGMPMQKLGIRNTLVTDLTPLSGMPLVYLTCSRTRISDLTPLRGMPLATLGCEETPIADLAPLQGMPLQSLDMWGCGKVTDLSPLKDLPLKNLTLAGTRVTDLSPLAGMTTLQRLDLYRTPVADLSPLADVPLQSLIIHGSRVSDLSPLAGMPLTGLSCHETAVSDLSPLAGMPLRWLGLSGVPVADLSPLAGMPLEQLTVNMRLFHAPDEAILRNLPLRVIENSGKNDVRIPAETFWEEIAAQRQEAEAFVARVKDFPAEELAAAVAQRLREVNPKQTPELQPTFENGKLVAAQLRLASDRGSVDLTPLRALGDLRRLTIAGGPRWLDLSPLNNLPLEEITCSEIIALRNGPVLADMASLKKINGKPVQAQAERRPSEPAEMVE